MTLALILFATSIANQDLGNLPMIKTPLPQQEATSSTNTYQEIPDFSALTFLNPDLKERKVGKIRLQNGLEVFLISDPGADQSSASVAVDAGSWNDPEEYPGMAHFCEHMLFMGSAKYPDSNDFMNHVSDHGGTSNAYTAAERTVYMFSCKHSGFLETLDRFSRFFIDPLFDPANISRELHAVDQEFAKNLENDRWREYMVFKEMGNPNHPIRKFSSGNSQTLGGIPSEALKAWHEDHYGANRMHLFLYSNLPIEEMKQQAALLFSGVPEIHSSTKSINEQIRNEAITSYKQRGHIAYIKPIQNRQTFTLSWELSQSLSDDESHSAKLVAYALSRGQPYSLYEKLKEEQLIDNVSISVDDVGGKDHRFFSVSLDLTPKGIAQVQIAVLRIFEALSQLKKTGIPIYLFQERNAISQLSYQYQTRQDAFQMAESIGESLPDESLSTFPRGQVLASSYSPEKIRQVLGQLVPEFSCISFSAPPSLSGVEPDKKEKWFGAEYAVRPIPAQWLSLWKNCQNNPDIRLAEPNPFLPSRVDLVPSSETASTPVLISETESGIAYYCRAPEFSAPEAVIHLHIRSPQIQPNARSSVLISLYLDHLTDLLHPTLAAAKSAGLYTRFELEKLKIHLQISGFNDKAPLLLQEILRKMSAVAPTKEQFEIYTARHEKSYSNASKNLPVSQGKELLESILMSERTSSEEKLSALQNITYEEFLQFYQLLLAKTYAEAIFTGNLTLKEAQSSWLDIQHILSRGVYAKSEHIGPKVLELPSRQGPFSLKRTTTVQGNAALLAIDQGSFSLERKSAQEILASALREAFFNELRTKQKTGYIAKADSTEIEERLFHLFLVQSNSHQPEDLLHRFELFFEEFLQTLQSEISPTRFENLKHSCIHSLKTRFRNLKDKSGLWNLLAFEKKGDFCYVEKRIQSLESLTYEQFCKFTTETLSRANLRRIAVLFEGRLPSPFVYKTVDMPRLLEIARYTTKPSLEQPVAESEVSE